MSAKLDRIGMERDKAFKKREEWDARYKELDKRYQEQENAEIHELVYAFNLTPEQLGQLLRQAAQALPSPEALKHMVKEDLPDETED